MLSIQIADIAMIILSNKSPLTSGGRHEIFVDPRDPARLIKVSREDFIARKSVKTAFWYGSERRYGHLKDLLRSLREQLTVFVTCDSYVPWLEQVVGFTETDRGIGLVVVAERWEGGLAPTLAQVIAAGEFDAQAKIDFDVFCRELVDSPIVVNDSNLRNIVYSGDASGRRRFVLIDGYGETSFMPLKSWLPWLNRRAKLKMVASLRRRVARRIERAKADQPMAPIVASPAQVKHDRTAAL
ncbi:YrbL family protein [Consotaella aegiceratis]|uniref:YrbL family protein n=1 Tax=Consotaella aegiceratis TaxID=3097961 RepID=UPI002F4156B2